MNTMLSLVGYEATTQGAGTGGVSEKGSLFAGLGFAPLAARLAETCRWASSKEILGCDKRLRRDSSGENGFIDMAGKNTLPRPQGKRFHRWGAARRRRIM